MGIQYYAFALFVAGLICVIAIICKVLFADVRRLKKLLDERESEVLRLYNTVETLMEEFTDQVKITTAEIKEHEYRATSNIAAFHLPPELEEKQKALEKLPRTTPLDATRIRVAGEAIERAERVIKSDTIIPASAQDKKETGAVFQSFFDETIESTPPPPQSKEDKKATIQTKTEMILAMSEEGKTDVEIASELGITRNEVLLVVGLKK